MFEALQQAPPDPILGLTEAFKKDSNPKKINLSVGVYKDASGTTPVLKCVKEAERRLVESETSKGYLPIDGPQEYGKAVRALLLGADHELACGDRAATLQTPGGTGALRVAADLISNTLPTSRIWLSNPTWANHGNIFKASGLEVENYTYMDAAGSGFDFEGMLAAVREIPAGDAICLHACCHNPSGIDPTAEQWKTIATLIKERGLLPVVDFAYQGLGSGLEQDAAGLVELCSQLDELLICSSFSKNFGLYCDRVGAMTIVTGSGEGTAAALSHAKRCVRCNYSNPPRHGGAVVTTVLGDEELRSVWVQEVAEMRDRINGMRQMFVDTMKTRGSGVDFGFITEQRGMFSFSGLSPIQVDQLKKDYGIYIVGSGRINVAGMTAGNMDYICDAVMAVL